MIKARRKYEFEPDYAVPPGETLKEVIDSLGMTRKELAKRTELTEQSIIRILKGEQPITYETSNKLEMATGVPAKIWNNLESSYREQLEKIRQKERLAADLDWIKKIPTKELIDRNYIERRDDEISLLRDTLRFFGVISVSAWREIWESPAVAARRSKCFETDIGAASTWIRMGELEAQEIECLPYDRNGFKAALAVIRALTKTNPEEFVPKMKRLCAESGVALALIPEMKKVPWNGASKWLTTDKALIILNLRGKHEDKFWFSFFHEASHILFDNKKMLYINDESSGNEPERKADSFAASFLVPRRRDEIPFLRTHAQVKALADDLGISPGIIAGQFQHVTGNYSWFNTLRRKFSWDNIIP